MSDIEKSHENIDLFLAAASSEIGLEIHPDYLPGVRKYLQISLQMMKALERIDLSIEEDPAPIYYAQ